MAALPYMQLYVSDYLSDTAHLTTEEHGAYLLLLFNYWQTGKPLRADRLATVARMSNDRWNSVELTLSEFFNIEVNPGSWTHLRVEADLHQVASKATQASDAGKKSALARALAKQASQTVASTGVATKAQRNANHTDTDTDTDTEEDQDQHHLVKFDAKAAFSTFWKLYPRKVSKAPSEKKFMTKCKDQKTFDAIMTSVAEHIKGAWNLTEMQYIPHASAWLNQERWNDEVSHVRPTNTGTNGQSRLSLVDQVRQRNQEREAERSRTAGPGFAQDDELPAAGLEDDRGGRDWEGEFARINPLD